MRAISFFANSDKRNDYLKKHDSKWCKLHKLDWFYNMISRINMKRIKGIVILSPPIDIIRHLNKLFKLTKLQVQKNKMCRNKEILYPLIN